MVTFEKRTVLTNIDGLFEAVAGTVKRQQQEANHGGEHINSVQHQDVHMHAHARTHIHTYMHAHTHVYIYIYVYIYMYIYIYIYIYI